MPPEPDPNDQELLSSPAGDVQEDVMSIDEPLGASARAEAEADLSWSQSVWEFVDVLKEAWKEHGFFGQSGSMPYGGLRGAQAFAGAVQDDPAAQHDANLRMIRDVMPAALQIMQATNPDNVEEAALNAGRLNRYLNMKDARKQLLETRGEESVEELEEGHTPLSSFLDASAAIAAAGETGMDALPPDQGVATEQVADATGASAFTEWDPSVLANAEEGTLAWKQQKLWGKNNPGAVRLRKDGNQYGGATGEGTDVATFVATEGRSAIENGLLAHAMNISAHRNRIGPRPINRGANPPHGLKAGKQTIEGGLQWAYDEFVTHAPFKENESRKYYDAYAGVAKKLGVYDGGKLNDTGDQRLVIMLVMHSREMGVALPYNPYETIDALGDAPVALKDEGRGDPEFAEWAKTAKDRWTFTRIDNDNVKITRIDKDGQTHTATITRAGEAA